MGASNVQHPRSKVSWPIRFAGHGVFGRLSLARVRAGARMCARTRARPPACVRARAPARTRALARSWGQQRRPRPAVVSASFMDVRPLAAGIVNSISRKALAVV
jgi:hypothetical protein